jgi:transposase
VAQAARNGGGPEALRRRPPPGRHPRLSTEHRAQLPALLARGVQAFGFRGEVWTAKCVAEVIWRTFGVRYHRDHVSRLLRQCGWSPQQPMSAPRSAMMRRSSTGTTSGGQRSKKASGEGATIVWVDESGFYLLPLAMRTWAPKGQTPVLHVKLTHDHLATMSGITFDGRLFL